MNSMKINMKSFRAFFIILLAGGLDVSAQQMNFSQYQMAPMLNNPSHIALGDELKVDFGYRNQFGGLSGNYGTPFVSAFKPLYLMGKNEDYKKFGAAGVQFVNDRSGYNGSLATTGFSLAYAHVATLSKRDKLILGIQVGFFQRRVDYGNLTSGNQWDAYNGAYDASKPLNENISANERRSFPLVNSGVTYVREFSDGQPFFTISASANNLNTPNVSLNNGESVNPLSLNVQGNIVAYENLDFLVKPTFRHIQEAKQSQTNLGSYIYYKFKENVPVLKNGNMGLGLWYSSRNAAVAALEVNMKDWALGFSYDFLVSSLGDLNNTRTGAPEFVIGFRKYIGKNKKVEVVNISPAPVVTPVKPEEKPVSAPVEAKPEEPKKPVEEVKPATPVEEAKPEPAKENQAQKVEDKVEVAPKKEITPAEVERERSRKRQIYMTPVGFQGTDPFAGSRIALSKEDREFLGKSVKFKLNGYELSPESARHLEKVAKVLKKHPNLKIDIKGFGCDLGSPEANLKISQGRANATKAFLVKRGVPAKQLRAKGYGTIKPEDDIKVD